MLFDIGFPVIVVVRGMRMTGPGINPFEMLEYALQFREVIVSPVPALVFGPENPENLEHGGMRTEHDADGLRIPDLSQVVLNELPDIVSKAGGAVVGLLALPYYHIVQHKKMQVAKVEGIALLRARIELLENSLNMLKRYVQPSFVVENLLTQIGGAEA